MNEPTRNDSVNVGMTSVLLSEARNEQNPRVVITVRNISSNAADIISVTLGYKAAVVNNGLVLRQYESFTWSSDIGYPCHQGAITAICVTANGVVSIMEK